MSDKLKQAAYAVVGVASCILVAWFARLASPWTVEIFYSIKGIDVQSVSDADGPNFAVQAFGVLQVVFFAVGQGFFWLSGIGQTFVSMLLAIYYRATGYTPVEVKVAESEKRQSQPPMTPVKQELTLQLLGKNLGELNRAASDRFKKLESMAVSLDTRLRALEPQPEPEPTTEELKRQVEELKAALQKKPSTRKAAAS